MLAYSLLSKHDINQDILQKVNGYINCDSSNGYSAKNRSLVISSSLKSCFFEHRGVLVMQEIKLSPCCGSTDDWKVILSLSPTPLIGICIYLHIFIDTYLSTYIYIYKHAILYIYTHLRVFPPQHFWHHLGLGYYMLKGPSWHCGTLSSLPRVFPLDAHSPPHTQFQHRKHS